MPTTYTHIPPGIEHNRPGIGGKPPVDKRPTGGGGSGDDDHHSGRSQGPGELLKRCRIALFCVLAGDTIFFVVLALLFFARQSSHHFNVTTHEFIGDWHPVTIPPILFLNTAVLLLSSLTMEVARHHIFLELDVLEEWLGLGRPALHRTLPWIAVTLTLGMLFLAGQWIAWRQLTEQGFAFNQWSTPASYFFYIITGFHALHLLVGVAALALCLAGLGSLGKVELRQIAVDAVGWYWHAMGAAWILLFFLLEACQ